MGLDFERIAADFLRALRGKRSQTAFCRRLGYRSNVAYTWEAGRGFPSAARTFEIAGRLGIDVQASLRRFYVAPPPWLGEVDLTTRAGVARLLRDLQGETSIVSLARYSGKSRFAVSRWLKGEADPRLNEFFLLVEHASLRLIDLIEVLVDPDGMPSIRERARRMGIARSLAYDAPWTQVVLRALELDDYRRSAAPLPPEWIAERIGIEPAEARRCLELLLSAGQIRKSRGRYRIVDVMALDVRRDPERARAARGFWGQVAATRSAAGRRGTMYTVCGVSAADLERLRELERAYFNQVRAIVSQSEPVERVVLSMAHLIDLGEGDPAERDEA